MTIHLMRLLLVLLVFGPTSQVHAETAGFLDLLGKVVRVGGKLADDVPDGSISRGLRRSAAPDALSGLPDGAAIRAALKRTDPGLLRQIEQLQPAEAEIALRLFAGSEVLLKASPDVLARARAVEKGGSDLLLASERYGDRVTTPAFRLLAAEDMGQLPAGSLQRFSETVAARGDTVLKRWNETILPNWKKIAAAGLLADIIFNDGEWISATGEFTTSALKKLIEVGIDITVDTVAAIPEQIVKSVWSKLWGENGIWVLLTLFIIGLPASIGISRIVIRWITTLKSLWKPRVKSKDTTIDETKIVKRNPLGGSSMGAGRK